MDSEEHGFSKFHPAFPIAQALLKANPLPPAPESPFSELFKERPVVTIYVRKGDHAKERLISINPIPAGVEPLDLLDAGFALDGNSATLSVDAYIYVVHHQGDNALGMRGLLFPGEHFHVASFHRWEPGGVLPGDWAATWTLTRAVNAVEAALVDWLRAHGCAVKFG